MRAEAIAPVSPGKAARMRASMASRVPATAAAKRSLRRGGSGGSSRLMAPSAKPVAPIC
jgi:hypothetical protein